MGGDVRGNATNDQTGTRKLVPNPVVERDGEASDQLDENQVQPTDVSLNQNATRTVSKQRAGTQWTTSNVENWTGGLWNVVGHQAERGESMLSMETIKFSASTIADVSYQFQHYIGKLGDGNEHVAKHFGVIRRKKKSESIDGTKRRMAAVLIEAGNLGSWRFVNSKVNQIERYDEFADAQAVKVFLISMARAASQRLTELGHRKRIAILDACFHADMDELIHGRPPQETESWCIVVQLLLRAHVGARRAA